MSTGIAFACYGGEESSQFSSYLIHQSIHPSALSLDDSMEVLAVNQPQADVQPRRASVERCGPSYKNKLPPSPHSDAYGVAVRASTAL